MKYIWKFKILKQKWKAWQNAQMIKLRNSPIKQNKITKKKKMIKTATMSCSPSAAHSRVLLQDLASDTSCPTLNDLKPSCGHLLMLHREQSQHMVDSKEGCIQQEHRGNRLLVTPRLLSSVTTGLKLYREQLGCCLASDPPGDNENTSDSKRIFQKGWEKKPLWAGNLWFPTHHSMLIAAHPITTNVNCACSEILTDCLIQPVSYYVNCYSVNLT